MGEREEKTVKKRPEEKGEEAPVSDGESGAPFKAVEGLQKRFGRHYIAIKVDVEPDIPPYDLPLAGDAIGNFDYVKERLKPGEDVERLILQNGFAAMSWRGDDFVKAYETIRTRELPVFVTSDSILHLYHIQFDEILKNVEQKEFFPDLEGLSREIIGDLLSVREDVSDGDLKVGLNKAVAFLSVGYELLTDYSEELEALGSYRDKIAREGYHYKLSVESQPEALRNAILGSPEAETPEFRRIVDRFGRRATMQGEPPILKILDRIIGQNKEKSHPLDLPGEIRSMVDQDKKAALQHKDFTASAIFQYKEDFTQYIPRGHYTRGYDLKRYFRCMMWLGRMTFLVKGGEPHGPLAKYLVSEKEARRQTIAACFLTRALRKMDIGGRRAVDIWERIYGVTAFFVGLADDLTYTEYEQAFQLALGKDYEPSMLTSEENLLKVKQVLVRFPKPAIYSGTGESGTLDEAALKGKPSGEELDKVLAKTQGFRFMGQRFVPDSYVMGKLVFPTVNQYIGERAPEEVFTCEDKKRMFPRGLDIMVLLGSDRALSLLQTTGDNSYRGYSETFEEIKKEFEAIPEPEGWNLNLYWSWLYCLKGLIREYGPGYQSYMGTGAWLDKQLNTALGSWSPLRHDTILYVKQSYTMLAATAQPREPKDFPGYVEPIPGFHGRLLALTRLTRKVLEEMNVLDEDTSQRLDNTEKLFVRLLDISKKELQNRPLSQEDEEWIKHFDARLEDACCGHRAEAMKTTIIADVHTDQNTGRVLQEGTGPIALILVANRLADGSIGLSVGPIFTYYEFKHPMSDRLTDEKWRDLLHGSKEQLRDKKPEFIHSFFVEK